MIVQGWEVRFSSDSAYKHVTSWLVEHGLADRIVDHVVRTDRFELFKGWVELIYDDVDAHERPSLLTTRLLHLYLPDHTVLAVLEIDVETAGPGQQTEFA